MSDLTAEVSRYANACYLFTKWDRNNILTIVSRVSIRRRTVPKLNIAVQLVFSLLSTRQTSLLPTFFATAWIWLHALFFCVCNQCSSIEEDRINKPYRPVPSGVITYREALGLLFVLIPICLAASWPFGATLASAGVMVASLAYTFLGLDSHWITKNAMNVAMWYPIYLGALTVSGTDSPL